MEGFLDEYFNITNLDIKPFIYEENHEIDTVNAVGVMVFATLLCFAFFGVVTEYSPLFDIKDVDQKLPIEKRKTSLGLFFLSFSVTKNALVIFNTPSYAQNSNLKILDGVRVVSMLWVIIGFGYQTFLETPISNIEEIPKIAHPWLFAFIQSAYFAGDIFFMISGFLGAYILLVKYFEKISMNIAEIYFHRIHRLFPALAFFLLAYITFFRFFGDGPVWGLITQNNLTN